MLLQKTLKLSEVELKTESDSRRFFGYASVFNGTDSYGDTIMPGAFKKSIETNGIPKMFFNHQWNMPIGKYTKLEEDSKGLYVEGEFTPGLQLADDVSAAMVHGTLDGLSIGGYVRSDDCEEGPSGNRIIHTWTRLMEISPVVFPADDNARIHTVKSEDILLSINELETIRDLEGFLRDVGSFSKGAAQALSARMKSIFSQRDAGVDVDAVNMLAVKQKLDQMLRQ